MENKTLNLYGIDIPTTEEIEDILSDEIIRKVYKNNAII